MVRKKNKSKSKNSPISHNLEGAAPNQNKIVQNSFFKSFFVTPIYKIWQKLVLLYKTYISPRRRLIYISLAIFLPLAFVGAVFIKEEMKTSHFQSEYFYDLASKLTFKVLPGASDAIRFPKDGPYDIRNGYSLLPNFTKNLEKAGLSIESQARISKKSLELYEWGIFPVYPAKTQAGLKIFDRSNKLLFESQYPQRVFPSFTNISPLITNTLLFIEDRNLLDESAPFHNPAVEWDRFMKAIFGVGVKKVLPSAKVQGGSTLATQLEKFRHSPEGRTSTSKQKMQQMFTGALRAYQGGKNTIEARKKIVLDYINSVPLAALSGYGEVNGLGDGLWAYFGSDFKEVNKILLQPSTELEDFELKKKAVAYKQILTLFLAHRRPTDYLGKDSEIINSQISKYLPLLLKEKVIDEKLFHALKQTNIVYRRKYSDLTKVSFLDLKAANLIRTSLLSLLGLSRLYELDRLDLTVKTTIDNPTQQGVSDTLEKLKNRAFIKKTGLEGFRLLDSRGDPGKITYSFTLYEKGTDSNLLRVQTDNFDQPLNINQGVKLDLGSTAKFRTLVTYLEVIAELHKKFLVENGQIISKKDFLRRINSLNVESLDPLSKWAISFIKTHIDEGSEEVSLKKMLEAAMARQYSASPKEGFFTGGGRHYFHNFNASDNGKVLSVTDALKNSVNLPFIRIMRDVVNYYLLHVTGATSKTLEKIDADRRQGYLMRFADKEGQDFIVRYYKKYQGKTQGEIINILLQGVKQVPKRFAAVFWVMNPNATLSQFSEFMKNSFPERELDQKEISKLFDIYTTVAPTLGDKGYVARIHPLELWVAGYLMEKSGTRLSDILERSYHARQEVYDWLFKTKSKNAQDKRIKMIMEAEAFAEIHRKWQNLGYPLGSLVPSLATAIGSSADRPDALAELMGIIVNNGKRLPGVRLERLEFADDTPYATTFQTNSSKSQQVLAPEIAETVREALINVVEKGTAVRLKGGLGKKEQKFEVGGKTGTGDHRFHSWGGKGGVKESRVVSRSATFVFFIGDRFFGTITAFVSGKDAARFKFTSALPVQILKILEPDILPLLEERSSTV